MQHLTRIVSTKIFGAAHDNLAMVCGAVLVRVCCEEETTWLGKSFATGKRLCSGGHGGSRERGGYGNTR